MSNEVILNLSFDNQTVTDLTGKWTLDGTPNATYEQIEGRDGYSIVEGSLGRCIVLNAVDQSARYDEYTVDFDMFVKSTYTSDYYIYYIFYLWSQKDPNIAGSFRGKIGEVLSIAPCIGGSEPTGVTRYSPIGRWVHVTITSGPTGADDMYHTAMYVDGVKLVERTDSGSSSYGNPFGISQRIIPCARDPGSFLMPNGPGVCLNTYKIVVGIHAPDQNPAISLFNLSRVFNNFCTWLKGQLSTVALTGSYNDLSNKPTISTVNNGTLTIQQNGTNVQTFTANASANATANIQCVDLTSNQTVAGNKTFSGRGTFSADCIAYNPDSSGTTSGVKLRNSKAEVLSTGNTASDQYITFRDKNDFNFGYIRGAVQSNGVAIKIGANAKDSSDTTINAELQLLAYSNGNKAIFPTTTDTYDLGRSAAQWNNAYIKSLIINGVACGDILTHNASEFVNVSSNQTIGGNKSFTGFVVFNPYRVQIKQSSQEIGVVPSSNQWNGINFTDKNNSSTFSIEQAFMSNGNAMLHFSMTPNIAGGSLLRIFESTYNASTDEIATKSRTLIPDANNSRNLGSPSLQWNNAFTRNILIDNDINIASSTISKTSTSGTLALRSGINPTDGASIGLYAKDYSGALSGCIYMTAYGNSDNTSFRIFPNGTITVYNNSTNTTKNVAMQEDVVPRSGGSVMTGTRISKATNDGEFNIDGGRGYTSGATLWLTGKDHAGHGSFSLVAHNGISGTKLNGSYDGTLSWNGQPIQTSSDQRLKQQITEIDDKLLDAWEDVAPVQFKYNDAVDQKKDKARLHTGYVVQQIDEACKSHNVDISDYGLYCHEEYPEETEEVEIEQEDGTKIKEKKVIREASEHYSLRYTEALIVECAYLRKCIKELRNEIEELKSNK